MAINPWETRATVADCAPRAGDGTTANTARVALTRPKSYHLRTAI
ncbi:hypothetical protein [Thalassobaculum sp.]